MRTKHTFKSKEIAHVWANQGATHGKSPGAMRFNGPAFYSYATVIARIIKHKGKTAFIVDGATFSPSTSGHQSAVRQAIPEQGAPVFRVDCGRRGQTLDFTPAQLRDHYLNARRELAKAPASKYAHKRAQATVERAALVDCALSVARFFGLGTARLTALLTAENAEVERASETLKAYYAKREQARNEREAKKRAARLRGFTILAERILTGAEKVDALPYDWQQLADETPGLADKLRDKVNAAHFAEIAAWRISGGTLPQAPTLLRRDGAEIVTSRGARVPIADAQRTFDFISRHRQSSHGWQANGEKYSVGMYPLNKVNGFGIVAGCHRIAWDEIERLALAQSWVQLVRHIPGNPDKWQLVSNSQDIRATLESIGKLDRLEDCGCLFVEIGDGEYLHVFGCSRSVPVLDASVFDLMEGGE